MINHPTSNLFAFQCINRSEFVGHAIYCEVFDIRELSSSISTACFRLVTIIFFENPHNHNLWRIEQSCRWFFCTFFVSLAQRRRLPKLPEVENQSDVVNVTVRLFDNQAGPLYLETYATSESSSDKIPQKLCDKIQKDYRMHNVVLF